MTSSSENPAPTIDAAIQCSETTQTTLDGLQFSLTCNSDLPGNDISSVDSQTLPECLDLCTQSINPLCAAAVFDSIELKCILKNSSTSSFYICFPFGSSPPLELPSTPLGSP